MTGDLSGPAEHPQDERTEERTVEEPTVTVLFFAAAREATGTTSASFGSAGQTIAQLASELVATYGRDMERVLGTCAVWVNGAPAPPSRVLRARDEVAVLPPVSGGAC